MKPADSEHSAIDFSPLRSPEKPYFLKNLNLTDGLTIVASLLVLVMVLAIISTRLLALATLPALAMAVFIGIWSEAKLKEKEAAALKRFATRNGFTFARYPGPIWGPGSLFLHGRSKSMSNMVAGTLHGLPFRMYEYRYDSGGSKNRRAFEATVLDITLPRKLPHMVIDSLIESGTLLTSTLPIHFDSAQRIELEGDFNKYFALYAPDSYGVTALSILAPDVMETLMRHATLCDIEIIDDKLYFYWPGTGLSKQNYIKKFQTVQAVLDEIGRKLKRGDIFGSASQARVHTEPTAGVRLKPTRWKSTALGIFALVMGNNTLSIFYPDSPLILILNIITLSVFGWIAWKLWQYSQLRKKLAERFADNAAK